ncbi:hypothetical protein C8R44DRAFT_725022 [Mycena epipterygia]|nr:hypothetical protein C8R44DRAFT_725022 [Mycena epipterygia]
MTDVVLGFEEKARGVNGARKQSGWWWEERERQIKLINHPSWTRDVHGPSAADGGVSNGLKLSRDWHGLATGQQGCHWEFIFCCCNQVVMAKCRVSSNVLDKAVMFFM